MNALALRLPRAFPVHKTRPCDLLNHYSPRASIPSSTALTTFLTKRHASSSTTTSSPTTTNSLALVNGPSSTLPAPLTLPTRGKDQSLPSFYFATGKTYLAFYKTGVKNIYYNYRSSKPIQQRIDNTYKSSLSEAVAANGINRQEFQLLARNWHDVKRVPVFALVFAICGEFTPLVVVFLSSVVPWTCRIPSQIEGDRRKLESRRRISFRNLTLPPPEGIDGGVEKLARMQLIHISWSLGLSSSVWDWLGGQFPGLPSFMVRKKVDKRVEYLEMDDKLIKDAGGIGKMELEECKMACIERGIDVIGRKDTDIKQDLNDWLKSRPKRSIEHLLLTRCVA